MENLDGVVSSKARSVAVVILTFNEEENIEQALESVVGWCNEIVIVDSFSSDNTVSICEKHNCKVFKNKFVNFSVQRNFALSQTGIESEWVLFLDADEWLPADLKNEITNVILSNPSHDGFYLNRRFMWMGQWVRRGYYPTWTLRLFRHTKGRCEDRAVNEHIIVNGECTKLKNAYVHEDRKSIGDWTEKHIVRARMEALELFNMRDHEGYREVDVSLFGSQEQRKRWIRYKIWNKLPPLIRPIFYFFYRYIVVGGLLDGKKVFTYHFLQALWFPMLIDIFYLEKIFKKDGK